MDQDSLFKISGILGLDGQTVNRMTLSKKGALMGAVVAKAFDELLKEDDDVLIEKLKTLKFDFKDLKAVEKELYNSLYMENLMMKKRHLLSCDLNYYTAGVEVLEYFSNEAIYNRYVEQLRAELLEEGEITTEAAMLFVIIRDSGLIHETFSTREQEEVSKKLLASASTDKVVAALLEVRFKDQLTTGLASLIKGKQNLFKNPYLEGLALLFPFLDRRSSIFIDVVVFGTDVKERRDAVINFLKGMGFDAKQELIQDRILLKIDNSYYSVWPTTRVFNRVPVQGIVLSPYYL